MSSSLLLARSQKPIAVAFLLEDNYWLSLQKHALMEFSDFRQSNKRYNPRRWFLHTENAVLETDRLFDGNIWRAQRIILKLYPHKLQSNHELKSDNSLTQKDFVNGYQGTASTTDTTHRYSYARWSIAAYRYTCLTPFLHNIWRRSFYQSILSTPMASQFS
ncbi:hypothetical protein NPIL_518531 [Nephila pilipes]|uniref:Uncharacterized protein n=1 Tax=Nephila pilipes TaxID=299642 RepID=A0A8X6NRA0_NEPPI|nr:hypothetical protein NPIL_518531 [Nephila pilipes]